MKTQFLDHRIAQCRHPRLREALQFHGPVRSLPLTAESKLELPRERPQAGPCAPTPITLTLVERFFIAVLRAGLFVTGLLLSPVS